MWLAVQSKGTRRDTAVSSISRAIILERLDLLDLRCQAASRALLAQPTRIKAQPHRVPGVVPGVSPAPLERPRATHCARQGPTLRQDRLPQQIA